MDNQNDPVVARELDHIDGAWATCPHCQQVNGVSWSGEKTCTQCGETFEVTSGPLVKDRSSQNNMQILVGAGGTLFYDYADISFPCKRDSWPAQ